MACAATSGGGVGKLQEWLPYSGEGLWDAQLRGWGDWQRSVGSARHPESAVEQWGIFTMSGFRLTNTSYASFQRVLRNSSLTVFNVKKKKKWLNPFGGKSDEGPGFSSDVASCVRTHEYLYFFFKTFCLISTVSACTRTQCHFELDSLSE